LIGALFTIFGAGVIGWAVWVIGILFVIMAVLDVLAKRMSSAITNGIIGALILVVGGLFTQIALLVVGILIAIRGIMDLLEVLKRKNNRVFDLILPVLTIVIGGGLAFGDILGDIIKIVGVLLIVDGLLVLFNSKK
jgi:hypothetical protein